MDLGLPHQTVIVGMAQTLHHHGNRICYLLWIGVALVYLVKKSGIQRVREYNGTYMRIIFNHNIYIYIFITENTKYRILYF